MFLTGDRKDGSDGCYIKDDRREKKNSRGKGEGP